MRRMTLLAAAALLFDPGSAEATLADCRQQLFVDQDIIAADDACADAVAADPLDGTARFFRAGSRILRVMGENTDGSDASRFTDSVKEMMDQFGISSDGRDIYDFSAKAPKNLGGKIELPHDSPDGSDVQDALAELLVPAITASIDDLRAIPQATVIHLTATEQQVIWSATGIPKNAKPVEVDYGDVKLIEAGFLLWKSQLLLLDALNVDIDLDSFTPIEEAIRIQRDVIDANPLFLTLLPRASCSLFEANMANREAIESYLAGSEFIRAEVDPQDEDLFTIEPENLAKEAEVRTHLASLRSSLDCPTLVLNEGTTWIDEANVISALNRELGTAFDSRGVAFDPGLFYEAAPFSPRDVLAPFEFDESRSRNFVRNGTYPDPTFRGVLLPVESLDSPRVCPAPPSCNAPPECGEAFADTAELWPPNHKFREVSVAGVVDPDGDEISILITSIFQDEPVDSTGDGRSSPDGTGIGTASAMLRAERTGSRLVPGDGRVYHVGFIADDGLGGQCGGSVTICVPHDLGKDSTCIDQGQQFDSTLGQ